MKQSGVQMRGEMAECKEEDMGEGLHEKGTKIESIALIVAFNPGKITY